MSEIPTPQQIAEELSRRVIGQRDAIREMSIALTKKLSGLDVGNVLMIGSSGTGKTTLMRAVEAYLDGHPELGLRSTVVRMHANVLGEEAQSGRPGEAVLHRLMDRAREQLGLDAPIEKIVEQAARGIVFIDEVDKIRAHVGDEPNTTGIRAQEALLTLIENEAVPVTLPVWAGGQTLTVDSRDILFVCGGAFEGLYDSVYDRVTIGVDRGSLKATTTVDEQGRVHEEIVFQLRDWLRNVDLFRYGMSPQFLARFDAVVLLTDLEVDELIRIFLETPDSSFHQTRAYFESRGLNLILSPEALRKIATVAHRERRLGARALKEVFRRVVRDYEFDPQSYAQGNAIVLDVPQVEAALAGKEPPKAGGAP